MFLKRLKLENVRCFKKLELDFSNRDDSLRKWTVIVGENGSGKSTILKAVALVTAGSDALVELLGDPTRWIRNNAEACEISAVLQNQKGEHQTINLEIARGDSPSDIISRSQSSLTALNEALSHTKSSYFVSGYGTSRRRGNERGPRQRSSSYRQLRAQSVATLFDNDAALNPLESWAMDLDYRRSETGLNTVRRVLNSFLPGLKFDSIDREEGALLFKTPDGIVPLQYLSDGYQNVAAWIGDLLHRITEVAGGNGNPLKMRGLLILDEIDLHLHPKWQRSLLSFLQEQLPSLQLLVTTHSAVTAQQAAEQEIHYLTRQGKTVTIHRFDSNPSRLLIHQLLMTDAFGLETDESLEVEQTKNRYRKLRDKEGRTAKEDKELESLKIRLRDITEGGATNLRLHEEQVVLLKKVQAELENRKK